MIKHVFIALLMWLVLALLRVPVIILGLVMVPVALPFRREVASARAHPWGAWELVRLPWWAWLWDNQRDGCLGDVRGDYWLQDRPAFIERLPLKWWPFAKSFWWLAIRNPCNNFSRYLRPNGVDVRTLNINLLAGVESVKKMAAWQYQFVIGRGPVFNYYGFYCLVPVGFLSIKYPAFYLRDMTLRWSSIDIGGGYINLRMGHKIETKHNTENFDNDPEKAMKGFTFRLLWDR